jgi:PTS system nitrogen regulatory IIA component
LQPQEILLDVDAPDRDAALEVAATAIGRAHALDWRPVLQALCRREQTGSTALGGGFAIPHARIGGISRPATVFMRTAVPLDFHAPDGKPVSHILVIMVPSDGANEDHLQLLALVAALFSDGSFRRQLDDVPDVATATEAFRTGIARLTGCSS